jgi:hypothetical protein
MNPLESQQFNPNPSVPPQPPASGPLPTPPAFPPQAANDLPERYEPYVPPAEPLRPIAQNPAWQQAPMPTPLPTMPTIPQPVPQPTPQLPEPQLPQPTLHFQPSGNHHSNKMPAIITIVALVAILGLSILAYTLLSGNDTKKNEQPSGQPTTNEQTRPEAITFDKLKAVTLIPPTNLTGFQANADNTNNAMSYTALDGACTLELGVAEQDGANSKEMAERYAQRLVANGLTVSEPKDGDTLQLKDAAGSDKVFVLETSVLTVAEGAKQTLVYFSAAPTADGRQVYVIRSCSKEAGSVEPATVAVINKEAATISVIAQQ